MPHCPGVCLSACSRNGYVMWVVHTGIVWCCTQHLCAAAYLEQCVGPLRPTLPAPLVHDSCLFIALSTSSNVQHGPLHCLLQHWHSCCLGQLLLTVQSGTLHELQNSQVRFKSVRCNAVTVRTSCDGCSGSARQKLNDMILSAVLIACDQCRW